MVKKNNNKTKNIKNSSKKKLGVSVDNKQNTSSITFPRKLLRPVGEFLSAQLQRLEKRRSTLAGDDPFTTNRGDENFASPDTNAAEQFGHARIEAMRAEMDKRIVQMRKALTMVKIGSYGVCENCKKMIDTDRLVVYPEATFCISCEKKTEKK